MDRIVFSSTKNEYLRGMFQNPQDIPNTYEPVDCDFSDELEFACIKKLQVEVKYWNAQNELHDIKGRILDLFTKDDEEFLKMSNQTLIRLDRICSVHILN